MKEAGNQSIDPQDVAGFFLSKKALSPKKVQKLVYYAYAWYIALYNQDAAHIDEVLFKEEPEAWMHGPVFPSLYKEYKCYGWNDIPKKKNLGLLFQRNKISSNGLKDFLEDVWIKYGEYTADQLEYMTHQEDPWRKARAGMDAQASSKVKISKEDIYIFYNQQLASK